MRRLGLLFAAGVFLLSGCRRAGDLPPSDVLHRATLRSRELQSVQFEAHAELASPGAARAGILTADLTGRLGSGGGQTAWTLTADGALPFAASPTTIHIEADVVTELPRDAYFSLRALTFSPALPGMTLQQGLIGTWWKLPSPETAAVPSSMTPDPRFLRAQAEVVRVTEDRGLVSIRGRDAYRYDVVIDEEKLLAFLQQAAVERGASFDVEQAKGDLERYDATGGLWIDAETFDVHRVEWNLRPKDAKKNAALTLRVDLSQHNAAEPITPPADFQVFESTDLLQIMGLPSSPLLR